LIVILGAAKDPKRPFRSEKLKVKSEKLSFEIKNQKSLDLINIGLSFWAWQTYHSKIPVAPLRE
jgi:hypothetical protein